MVQRNVKKTDIKFKKVFIKSFGVKSFGVAMVIIMFLLVAGCFNYKQGKQDASQLSEKDILKEIAKVEKEVGAAAPETAMAGVESANQSNKTEKEAEGKKIESSANIMNTSTSPDAASSDAGVAAVNVSSAETSSTNTTTFPAANPPPANQPAQPTVESDGEMQVITIKENEKVRLVAQLKDPDNDTINFTFSQPLDEKGEWKTDYSDAGEYISTLTVTDGKLITTKKVKIVVQRVNVPPVIETVHDITVNEGEVVAFVPVIKDPNNDSVTVTVSDPLKEGKFKTDHTSAGEYSIKVTASDGELTSEKSFKLIVKDVNVPPEIKGLQDITVNEGELVALKPTVTDIDNDNLKVTISNPVGDDGSWQTSFTDHGDYLISVSADDGKAKVTKQVKVTVKDVNMPPEILKITLQK